MDSQILIPTESTLEKMVVEEEKIRMSKEYQDRCTTVCHIPNGWLQVTADVQEQIAHAHGFVDETSCAIACNMARRAHILYPNNDIFKMRVQVRNNKARKGDLRIGDLVPAITLCTMDGDDINLRDLVADHNHRPTIIFSGSQT